MKTLKRTWAEVSLDNLEHNYRAIKNHIPEGCRFLGVMKADAYGHGAVPLSHALCELGAEYLAVSNLEEAIQLRRGIRSASPPGSWSGCCWPPARNNARAARCAVRIL